MINYQELTESWVPSTARLAFSIFKPSEEVDFNKAIADFSKSKTKCFIAIDGEEVVGLLTLNVFKPLFTSYPKAHISWIGVETNHRGKGIAKVLLQMAEQYCKNKSCKYMDLSSRISEDRISAHKLYDSFGFKSDTQKYFIKHFK